MKEQIINKGTKEEVLIIKDPPRGPITIPKIGGENAAKDPWKDWRPKLSS